MVKMAQKWKIARLHKIDMNAFNTEPRRMLKGSFREFSFFCSSVEEVPAAVGETNLLDKDADTRLNCQTALQTMSKIIL